VTPQIGFPTFLVVTVLLLAAVVVTGLKGRLRPHLVLVALALASLGTTIFFAERLGRYYDLEAAGAIMPIHLTLAKITTLGYLLPLVTGVLTLRDRGWKKRHLACALVILAMTVLTTVTGTWMVLAAPPL
jgi:hypothetical protein